MKNKTLTILLVFNVLAAACSANSEVISFTPKSIPEPTSTSIPPTIPSIKIPTGTPKQLGDIKTYHDEYARFALDYPATWYIEDDALQAAEESFAYTVSLFSWDITSWTPTSKDLNTLPDGTTKIDITVLNEGPKTLADAVEQFKDQESGTSVSFPKEEKWLLGRDNEAVYLEAEGVISGIATMITQINGKTVYVSGYGDLTLFKVIALTLRVE